MSGTTLSQAETSDRDLSLCKTDAQIQRLILSCGLSFVLAGSAARASLDELMVSIAALWVHGFQNSMHNRENVFTRIHRHESSAKTYPSMHQVIR